MEQNGEIRKGALALLGEVVKLPDMLFVMDKGAGVVEAWVSPEESNVILQDDWVGVETKGWHCHLNLSEVAGIRFVEEPDVHDLKRQAFSIRLLRQGGEPILMIFFCEMYDTTGSLVTEKVNRFRTLQKQYSH